MWFKAINHSFLIFYIEGLAVTYDTILFVNEPFAKLELVPVWLVMRTNSERAVEVDLTIQLGDDYHIQGVLFFLSTICCYLNLWFLGHEIWISVPSTIQKHWENLRFWNSVFQSSPIWLKLYIILKIFCNSGLFQYWKHNINWILLEWSFIHNSLSVIQNSSMPCYQRIWNDVGCAKHMNSL